MVDAVDIHVMTTRQFRTSAKGLSGLGVSLKHANTMVRQFKASTPPCDVCTKRRQTLRVSPTPHHGVEG